MTLATTPPTTLVSFTPASQDGAPDLLESKNAAGDDDDEDGYGDDDGTDSQKCCGGVS